MYKVLKTFADLQDNKHLYHEGDTYPRDNVFVSDVRIAELCSNNNALRQPLIEKVAKPKKVEQVAEAEPKKVEADGVVEVKPTRKRKKKEVDE